VRLEEIGQLKKFNDLIGNRTGDLPACSIVPQRTTLQRVPFLWHHFCFSFSPLSFTFCISFGLVNHFVFITTPALTPVVLYLIFILCHFSFLSFFLAYFFSFFLPPFPTSTLLLVLLFVLQCITVKLFHY
jgi:hypothetical protein